MYSTFSQQYETRKGKIDIHPNVVRSYKRNARRKASQLRKTSSWSRIQTQCLSGGFSTIRVNQEASRSQREGELIDNSKHRETEYGKSVVRNPARWSKSHEREKQERRRKLQRKPIWVSQKERLVVKKKFVLVLHSNPRPTPGKIRHTYV